VDRLSLWWLALDDFFVIGVVEFSEARDLFVKIDLSNGISAEMGYRCSRDSHASESPEEPSPTHSLQFGSDIR
jgi:hypothetical protein